MSLNIDVDITQANEELEGLREAKRSLEKIIDDYVNVGNKMKENWSGENADKFFNVKDKMLVLWKIREDSTQYYNKKTIRRIIWRFLRT